MTTFYVGANVSTTPFCCGMWEIGEMVQNRSDFRPTRDYTESSSESCILAWIKLLDKVRHNAYRKDYEGTRAILINFVRLYGNDQYDNQEFLDYVLTQKDIRCDFSFVNNNTKNTIRTIILGN